MSGTAFAIIAFPLRKPLQMQTSPVARRFPEACQKGTGAVRQKHPAGPDKHDLFAPVLAAPCAAWQAGPQRIDAVPDAVAGCRS